MHATAWLFAFLGLPSAGAQIDQAEFDNQGLLPTAATSFQKTHVAVPGSIIVGISILLVVKHRQRPSQLCYLPDWALKLMKASVAPMLSMCWCAISLFTVVNAILYIPDILLIDHWPMKISMPQAIADQIVKKPDFDRDMVSGIAFMLIAFVEYCLAMAFVDSWLGLVVAFMCIRITISLSPGHWSFHLHTEGHKYWTGGAYTFGNLPVHDYLWFVHGYAIGWSTIEHAKVHHVYHVMHPLDPDYIYDMKRNSVRSFMWFNFKSLFNNIMGLGVLRIYFFHPEVFAAAIQREVKRQYVIGSCVFALIIYLNPLMALCTCWAMMAVNMEININTWVQHGFLNYDNGDVNPWNSTTMTYEDLTWSGCSDHLKHHLLPATSQEEYIGWYKTPEANALRRKYGFHVFDGEHYYTIFWAMLSADYDKLVDLWVSIDEDHALSAQETDELKCRFQKELESVFTPTSWLKSIKSA
eukprot:TRINITY_DN15790_c0_g1_i1.p1 TRINITY_DN15790_c0_g1~~TRINITY_DN15790_c0_g1_i1.p1  ORF type:complete len:468 (-),score=26.78 TRINITY_DN15790_c0_g1_i1:221-1624(-)